MRKRNFTRLFDSRQSHLDSRIRRDYIANGIATIHCQISKYNDIISAYSVKDQESLNLDFVEYLEDAAEPIPDECPLVLNVIGGSLSAEKKKLLQKLSVTILLTGWAMLKGNCKKNSNYLFLCLWVQSLRVFSYG